MPPEYSLKVLAPILDTFDISFLRPCPLWVQTLVRTKKIVRVSLKGWCTSPIFEGKINKNCRDKSEKAEKILESKLASKLNQ